jgi:hypothetical protein
MKAVFFKVKKIRAFPFGSGFRHSLLAEKARELKQWLNP